MLVSFVGDTRERVADYAAPGESAVPRSNYIVSTQTPGYAEIYLAHLRGQCLSLKTKELPPNSPLFLGLESGGAYLLVSCPVGQPLRGAVSISYDFPVEAEAIESLLASYAEQFEPILSEVAGR